MVGGNRARQRHRHNVLPGRGRRLSLRNHLDSCRDPDTGNIAPWAQAVIDRFATYTEVSPSGTGAKAFFTVANADLAAVEALFEGKHGRSFKNGDGEHPPAIEVYRGRRYFTVTEESIGPHDDLRLVDLADLRWLICEAGPKFSGSGGNGPDASRSARAFRAGTTLKAAGASYREMRDALLEHEGPEIAEWARTKGLDSGERELRRIFDKAGGDEPAVRLQDFVAYMQSYDYVYMPAGDFWPAARVDARVPPVKLFDKSGLPIVDENTGEQKKMRASAWLAKHAPVEQMTWAPGLPQLVRDKLISEGGWIDRKGVTVLNLYRPPDPTPGDATKAGRGSPTLGRIYPDEADHIIAFLAHRVQRPNEKINHGLVLGGLQGIGKDTLLEPVKRAVGAWNFVEVSPQQMLGRFNGFLKSVVLRISEAKDMGEFDRFKFYDHMKAYMAAPPDVLRVDEKNLREHSVVNVCGVVMTTNHKTDGIYLPADDRRHYVAWSDADEGRLHRGLLERSLGLVRARRLRPRRRLSRRARPLGLQPEGAAAQDASLLGDRRRQPRARGRRTRRRPRRASATRTPSRWNAHPRRPAESTNGYSTAKTGAPPHRLEQCGYVPVRNDAREDGLFIVNGRRQVVYALSRLPMSERLRTARTLAK